MNEHSSLSHIQSFLALEHQAVAGVSRKPNKFGNIVFREMRDRQYMVVPINRFVDELEGAPTFKKIADLPAETQGLVLVTPPAQTIDLVQEALAKGITNIWMQPGAEHPEAIDFCMRNNMTCIHNECILMHLEPIKSIHSFHRFLRKLFGHFPK